MPLFSFEGASPKINPKAWVAPTATLIGDVTVEAGASVWYGVVIRADFGTVVVRSGANVQDNAVIHSAGGQTEIGENATVAHSVVFHGERVGASALVGNGAIVQDNAVIGERSMVAAGALITPGTQVPPETIAMGAPAKEFKPLTDSQRQWVEFNGPIYQDLARRHAEGARPV
jgi:carbonic anhydrase/acetyltransferase-like protein (isoleucine patch superfamily)